MTRSAIYGLVWAATVSLVACGDSSNTCGPGTTVDEHGDCVATTPRTTCSKGTLLDVATNTCVIDPASCQGGTTLVGSSCQGMGPGSGGSFTNGAGANVIMKSDGTNAVASVWTDDGSSTVYGSNVFTASTATGNVGFNTAALTDGLPQSRFNVVASSADDIMFSRWGGAPQLTFKRAGGTFASPTPISATGGILQLALNGYDGTAFSGNQLVEEWAAAGNWAAGAHGTFWAIKNIPRATTTPVPVYYIDSVGGQLLPWKDLSVLIPAARSIAVGMAAHQERRGRDERATRRRIDLQQRHSRHVGGAVAAYSLQIKNNRSVSAGAGLYTNTVLGIDVQNNASNQINQAIEVEDGEGNGILKLFANGHVALGPGKAALPGLSACGGGATFAANSPASDAVGRIMTGTANTGCTITFANTYTKIPACWCMDETAAANLVSCTPNATSLTFVMAANSSNLISYHCVGPTNGT